jgi:hypothetical protein
MTPMMDSAEREEGPWFAVHRRCEVQITDASHQTRGGLVALRMKRIDRWSVLSPCENHWIWSAAWIDACPPPTLTRSGSSSTY